MKIGNINVRSRVFLAPMVDVTDLPYRLLCKKYSAGMVYTEMIVANSIVSNSKIALENVKTCEEERPVGIQLAGNDKEIILKAAERLKSDLIDLNFGCPSHKVTGSNMCSALLDEPKKIGEITKYVVNNLSKPVSAKIRLGNKKRNYLDVAKELEENGASAICLHARTAVYSYGVKADWKAVEELKKRLDIPLIGNGDVADGRSAKELLDKIDFVMVARAAIGDPFIFDRINRYLKDREVIEMPDLEKKYKTFLEYVDLCKKYEMHGFSRLRRMSLAFAKNVKNSSKLKNELNYCKNLDEIKVRFEKFI